LLLEKGKTIMTTKDNNGDEEVTESKNDATFDMPIVILANENTASASEILIGALKDNERATVIGITTYGKGVIQTVISLSDGSGLKITTAEYFTPNGTAIHGIGIVPDTEVELPDTVTSIYSVSRENDTQLNKAIEVLKQSK
jgi:carboxyl-terminal processing protease